MSCRYRALQQALDDALRAAGIDVRFGAAARAVDGTSESATVEIAGQPDEPLRARLAVVADGAASTGARRRRASATTTGRSPSSPRLTLDHPHGGVAFERFTRDGPMALLPEA